MRQKSRNNRRNSRGRAYGVEVVYGYTKGGVETRLYLRKSFGDAVEYGDQLTEEIGKHRGLRVHRTRVLTFLPSKPPKAEAAAVARKMRADDRAIRKAIKAASERRRA